MRAAGAPLAALTKRGPPSPGGEWGPKFRSVVLPLLPLKAAGTIQVLYLFVTILWETRGVMCPRELVCSYLLFVLV